MDRGRGGGEGEGGAGQEVGGCLHGLVMKGVCSVFMVVAGHPAPGDGRAVA